MFLPGTEPKKC
jgi:hypothetical protein